jgi:transcriptional regulator with XRE-family HTH domain
MEPDARKLSSILIEAMQVKNMSLEKLASVSGVSERFIEPLLRDDYGRMPASPYLHGYILKISQALAIDGEYIWENYFKASDAIRKAGKSDALPRNRFEKVRIDRKYIVGAVLALLALVYIVSRVQAYFSPPPLSLEDFSENMVVDDSTYTVRGSTDPKNQLFLNGEQIYPAESGAFEREIELQPGFNALSFKIKKFLGREYVIEHQIYWKTATSTRGTIPALESSAEREENSEETATNTENSVE